MLNTGRKIMEYNIDIAGTGKTMNKEKQICK